MKMECFVYKGPNGEVHLTDEKWDDDKAFALQWELVGLTHLSIRDVETNEVPIEPDTEGTMRPRGY